MAVQIAVSGISPDGGFYGQYQVVAWCSALPYVAALEGRLSAFYKAVHKFIDPPRLNIMLSSQRMCDKGSQSVISYSCPK